MTYFISFVVGFAVVGLLFVTYCLFRMASLEDQRMEQMRIKSKMEKEKDSNVN